MTIEDFYDPELELLDDDSPEDESTGSAHAFRTAPIFTGDALAALGSGILPQRALYGRVISQKALHFPTHPAVPKLYINTNAPFSALVCGVQVSNMMYPHQNTQRDRPILPPTYFFGRPFSHSISRSRT